MLAALLAKSTRTMYASGERTYLAFCEKLTLAPIPASVETLAFFVASLSQDHSASTAHAYLAAVQKLHILFGLSIDQFTSSLLALVTRAIKRSQAAPARPHLPMTIGMIARINSVLPAHFTDGYERHMLWCAFTLAFFGFFCVGELTSAPKISPPPRLGDISPCSC